MQQSTTRFRQRLAFRKSLGGVMYFTFLAAVLVGIVALMVLIVQVLIQGLPWLDWNFITSYPSPDTGEAGILSALFGTIWLMVLTALFTIPVGVGAAIYLEEYAPSNRFTQLIEVNISNLAGVPSIVYGLLGLAVFVQ